MNGFEQLKIWLRYTRLTAILMIISIFVALVSDFGRDFQLIHVLFISEYSQGLKEILNGELWRLFTPAFIHFGIIHILFNMLWLYQLGSAIEQSQHIKRLAVLVIVISLFSNLAQYFWAGPMFGGMSGVVYGLLAYLWVQGKYNPWAGIGLDQNIVVMMLVWFVICWLGFVGNVANMAHTIGLVTGAILGLIFSPNLLRRLRHF